MRLVITRLWGGFRNCDALRKTDWKEFWALTRERFTLVSYFFLLALFVADFVLILLFPGSAASYALWFGPIFILLGVQLIYFRNEHARIWEAWGGPQARVFAFVGFFFLLIGLYFAFATFG